MYRKTPKGWLKHWDFMFLEIISLQVSFLIAYYIRNARNLTHIYQSELYVDVACILFLVDICVIYFAETFKDVLKRGIYKELAKTFKAYEPKVESRPHMDWIQAVHPLLALSLEKQDKKVVPLDIMLGKAESPEHSPLSAHLLIIS